MPMHKAAMLPRPAAATSKKKGKQTKAANRALQRKVRSALSKTKGVSVANIVVRARDGDVTLEGSVGGGGNSTSRRKQRKACRA